MSIGSRKIRGFTLLELMIATAIIVVALTGLLAIFSNLLSMNERAVKLAMAITSCQDKMEQIRDADFNSLFATYDGTSFQPAGFPASEAKGSVYIDNSDPDLLKTYVSVSWKEKSDKVLGEDANLNGIFDPGEDTNGDNRLTSPAEIVTLIGAR